MENKKENNMSQARQAYNNGDYEKAHAIWLIQAEDGNPEAQAWLGSLYANGEGVDTDDKNALSWYEKAAEQGNSMAQANVGAMYYMGQGTSKNVDKAIKWLSAAAENGDVNGLFNLAVIYTKGEEVDKNLERAAELLNELESIVKSMSAEEKAMGATLSEQWRNKTGANTMQVAMQPTPSN